MKGESTLEMGFHTSGGWVSPEGKRYAEDEVKMKRTQNWDLPVTCVETGEILPNAFFHTPFEEREKLGWKRVEKDPSRVFYARKAYWFDDWFHRKLGLGWNGESTLEPVPLEVFREFVVSLQKAMEIIGDRYIPGPDEIRITEEQSWLIDSRVEGHAELVAMFNPASLFFPDSFDNWIARDMKEALKWCRGVLPLYESGELETVWFSHS